MATITITPQYPIPGQSVRVVFGGLHADTNFVQVFALTAPDGSSIKRRITTSTTERPRVHDGPSSVAWDFTPEVGGVYRFRIQEERHQRASGAMFQNDPAGAAQPEVLTASTVSLSVGQRLQQTVGTSPNTVQLRLYVWGDTVRATTVEVHGERTPALINPSSTIARNAASNIVVQGFTTDLAGQTASAIVGNFAAVFANLRTKYNNHLPSTTWHNAADTVNGVSSGVVAVNATGAGDSINTLRRALRAHQDNSGGDFHTNPDGHHRYVTPGASQDPVSQMTALADALLIFEKHITTASGVHDVQDFDNTVSTDLTPLLEVHYRFLEAVISQTPAVPVEVNSGVATLSQLGGFAEV